MDKTIFALAQSASIKGDIEKNLQKHRQFIELAAEKGSHLIAFPELSLTGYEPDLAAGLAFVRNDERLNPLVELSAKHQIIIVAGAPYQSEIGLHIAAFILYPNRKIAVYTKRYLHSGEEKVFIPGDLNPAICLGKEKIAIAVCADMANPLHPKEASRAGSTLYLASAFITPGGYEMDASILKGYAQKHTMAVMMVNYSGESGGYLSAGQSAVWSEKGELVGKVKENKESILFVTKEVNTWKSVNVSLTAQSKDKA